MEIPVGYGPIFKRTVNRWEKLLLNSCSETSQRCLTSLNTWPFGHVGLATRAFTSFWSPQVCTWVHWLQSGATVHQMFLSAGLVRLTFYHLHWLSISSLKTEKKNSPRLPSSLTWQPLGCSPWSEPLLQTLSLLPNQATEMKNLQLGKVAEVMVWQFENWTGDEKRKSKERKSNAFK